MKTLTEYLWFDTRKRVEFVNITEECNRILADSGITEGLMLVSAMHITASIWVNDNEPGIWRDAEGFPLSRIRNHTCTIEQAKITRTPT